MKLTSHYFAKHYGVQVPEAGDGTSLPSTGTHRQSLPSVGAAGTRRHHPRNGLCLLHLDKQLHLQGSSVVHVHIVSQDEQ